MLCSVIEHGVTSLSLHAAIQKDEAKLLCSLKTKWRHTVLYYWIKHNFLCFNCFRTQFHAEWRHSVYCSLIMHSLYNEKWPIPCSNSVLKALKMFPAITWNFFYQMVNTHEEIGWGKIGYDRLCIIILHYYHNHCESYWVQPGNECCPWSEFSHNHG